MILNSLFPLKFVQKRFQQLLHIIVFLNLRHFAGNEEYRRSNNYLNRQNNPVRNGKELEKPNRNYHDNCHAIRRSDIFDLHP